MVHSKRSVTVVCFALLCAIVLIVTSKRLDGWPGGGWQSAGYYRPGMFGGGQPADGQRAPPPGGGNAGEVKDQYPLASSVPVAIAVAKEQEEKEEYYLPETNDIPPRPIPAKDPACAGFPDTSNVMLVMKTGASEAYGKVPTQLLTVLRCLPDFLIFSDMEQRIAGYRVRDSLDTVLAEAKDDNPDFDLYRRQRGCEVSTQFCNDQWGGGVDEGWALDKYKNIHMAEKAWALRPGRDWYVFVDADTYVLWPNMMEWLGRMDPARKHYLGSMAFVGAFPFGHGGSGYVVSGGAMGAFAEAGGNGSIANKYDTAIAAVCCGDFMYAVALKETIDVDVNNMWPTINGEKPSTLPFGPTHWCHPIVTMHHLNSEEISPFWEFERKHWTSHAAAAAAAAATATAGVKTPAAPTITIKDIYHEFLAPRLKAVREDWDNDASDAFFLDPDPLGAHAFDWKQLGGSVPHESKSELQRAAHGSFGACAAACEELPDCFRFRWGDGSCGIGRAFLLGAPAPRGGDADRRTVSGWKVERIRAWIGEQPDCTRPVWPIPT